MTSFEKYIALHLMHPILKRFYEATKNLMKMANDGRSLVFLLSLLMLAVVHSLAASSCGDKIMQG